MMRLYEITTLADCHCYAWARDVEHAKNLFADRFFGATIKEMRFLFHSSECAFISGLSEHGFLSEYPPIELGDPPNSGPDPAPAHDSASNAISFPTC